MQIKENFQPEINDREVLKGQRCILIGAMKERGKGISSDKRWLSRSPSGGRRLSRWREQSLKSRRHVLLCPLKSRRDRFLHFMLIISLMLIKLFIIWDMCNVSPLVPTRLDSAQFPSFSMITEYHHDRRGVIIAAKSPTTQT